MAFKGHSKAASKSLNSKADETIGNVTVDSGDLLVSEKNFDRQTHILHMEKKFLLNQIFL